jgi:hypothetical protein
MTTPAINPGAALAAAKRAARRERDWDWYLSLYGHGDCFVGFLRILPELDREEPGVYWRLLRDRWTRVAAPWRDLETWCGLFAAERPDRWALMDDEELEVLSRLPKEATVYRGVGHPDHIRGLSWTLSVERAVWFANRRADTSYSPKPSVATGRVEKADVIAYLSIRDEQEVVALPDAVMIERIEEAS